MGELRRDLGLVEATSITIGSMVGAGIFFAPGFTARAFDEPWMIVGLWAAGGIVTLCGALAVAEMAAMFPRAGGAYDFLREAFGEGVGFVASWSFTITNLGVGAAVAYAFALYAARIRGLTDTGLLLVAAWAVVAVLFLNYRGVKLGGLLQDGFAALKVVALLFVVGAAFALTPEPAQAPSRQTASAATALAGILFAYNSWINSVFMAEEVRNPRRTLPLALLIGIAVVTVGYVGTVLAYLHLLGPQAMSATDTVASEALDRVLDWGGLAIAAAIMVSAFGNLQGGLMVRARLPFALARDGLLPAPLARLNRHGVPGTSLLAIGTIVLVILFSGTFESIVTFSAVVTWGMLAATVLALPALRRRRPDLERPYRAWGYPVTPALFFVAVAFVVGLTILQQPWEALAGLVVVASGVPVYLLMRRRSYPSRVAPPA